MTKNIEGDLKDLFRSESEKIKVYLRSQKTKSSSYDPFRNTGYTISRTNPIIVKAIVRDIQPEKLIAKEMGLAIAGAKELLIQRKDVNLIRLAEKIEIDNTEYVTYNDALGNKLIIFNRSLNLSRVIIFLKDK